MDDLISRQQAIDALDCINGVEEVLRSIPSAQPTIEPRRGKWIYNQKRGTMKIWTCSECGWNDIGEFNFCPNCGADMRQEEEQ